MAKMTSRSTAALQAIVAGILFSTGGAAVKATELDAGWWRSAAPRRALLLTLGTGCCYCLTLVLFVHANKRTTAAETIFLQSTAPLFVLLLSPILLRERPGARQLLFVPLFGAGLVMAFFGGADAVATAPNPRTGNVLAMFCGLAYGLTLIGLRAAGRPLSAGGATGTRGEVSSAGDGGGIRAPGIAAAACGNVIVCVACLPVMAPLRSADPGDLAIVALLGLFQVALGYVFVTRAARILEAPVLALLLLLEPALSPFWAMWFHGEQPHLLTWLGGGVIATATVLLATVGRSAKE